MKAAQTFKTIVIVILAFLPFSSFSSVDLPKEIRKSFEVSNNVKLLSHVNFADINITAWDQNRMEIVVRIDVSAKSDKRAQEIMDKIQVSITENANEPKVQVEVGNLNCGNGEQWNVDVEVKMPANGSIYADNSFGDFKLGSLNGRCELTLEYGNAKIGSVKGRDNRYNISFGDLKVDDMAYAEVKVEYGNARLGAVSGDFRARVEFGDITVNEVKASCKFMQVSVEYGDADITLGAGYGATFEARSSYGDVDLPATANVTRKESDYTSSRKTGTIGNGGGTLKVEASFGDVELR